MIRPARKARNNAAVLTDNVAEQPSGAPGVGGREGGEPACHLHLVCPECGYLDDHPPGSTCRRCGAVLHPDALIDSQSTSVSATPIQPIGDV